MFTSDLGAALNVAAVFVAVAIVVYGLRRLGELRRDLAQLDNAIEQAEAALVECDSPTDLALSWTGVSAQFEMIPLLRDAWLRFARGATLRDVNDGMGVLSSPYDHFNFGLLYEADLKLRHHEATPNQLVGIGLLFTFVGLTISLLIASSGLEADVEQAKRSLIVLMGASAFKFVTSIAAIGSALYFTRNKNRAVAALHSRIDNLARHLGRLTSLISAEQIAEESLAELAKQTGFMEVRNQELATAIAAALDERLQTSLKDAMSPIAGSITGMAEKMGEINEAAMRYMVERFTKELGSAAREHSERMAELLNEVSRAVQGVPEKIERASAQLSESIEKSARDVEVTFGHAGQALARLLTETSDAVKNSADGWGESTSQYAALTNQMGETQRGFAKQLEAIQETTNSSVESLGSLVENMRVAVATMPALDKTAHILETASTSLVHVVEEISKIERLGVDAQQRALAANDKFLETVAGIEREMTLLDKSLAGVFEKTASGLDGLQRQSGQVVAKLDEHMADAVDRLVEAINVLHQGATSSSRSNNAGLLDD